MPHRLAASVTCAVALILCARVTWAQEPPPQPQPQPQPEPGDLGPHHIGETHPRVKPEPPPPLTPTRTPPVAPKKASIDRAPAPAQKTFEAFTVLVDQDVLMEWVPGAAKLNEDRNYSMGIAFQYSGSLAARAWWLGLPWLLRGFDKSLGLEPIHTENKFGVRERASLTFGHSAFTPDELGDYDVIPGDRPYASLLYLTSARLSVSPDRYFALRTDLTFGMLGMPIGRPVQAWIHEQLRGDGVSPKDPKGWPHQISDGGEPTLRYGVNGRWLVPSTARWLDLSVLGEVNAGTYTNVAAGLTLRMGFRNTPFWGFDSNPLGYANQATRGEEGPDCLDAYAFIGVRERAVAYNALLQGQFRHSDLRVHAADVERLITEFEVGFVIGKPGYVSFTWAVFAGRTPEYEGVGERPHLWGSMYLTFGGGK